MNHIDSLREQISEQRQQFKKRVEESNRQERLQSVFRLLTHPPGSECKEKNRPELWTGAAWAERLLTAAEALKKEEVYSIPEPYFTYGPVHAAHRAGLELVRLALKGDKGILQSEVEKLQADAECNCLFQVALMDVGDWLSGVREPGDCFFLSAKLNGDSVPQSSDELQSEIDRIRKDIQKTLRERPNATRWDRGAEATLAFLRGEIDGILPDLRPLWTAMHLIGGNGVPEFPQETPETKQAEPYRTLKILDQVDKWNASCRGIQKAEQKTPKDSNMPDSLSDQIQRTLSEARADQACINELLAKREAKIAAIQPLLDAVSFAAKRPVELGHDMESWLKERAHRLCFAGKLLKEQGYAGEIVNRLPRDNNPARERGRQAAEALMVAATNSDEATLLAMVKALFESEQSNPEREIFDGQLRRLCEALCTRIMELNPLPSLPTPSSSDTTFSSSRPPETVDVADDSKTKMQQSADDSDNDPLSKLRDVTTASVSEIANALGQPYSRVESCLRRIREKRPSCTLPSDPDAKRRTDPTHLYRIPEILSDLEKALIRWKRVT
jgi:hypothetical protein